MATLVVAMPQTARAVEYSVCPLPAICDFTSPEDAVNDIDIVDGDIINIVTDIYVLASTLQVDNSITILANNSVFDADGRRAINVTGAATNLSLTNVTIRNGLADASSGGALRVSDGAIVTIINGTFENNRADFGGAVHNFGSTVNMNVAVFSGNRALAGDGGAVLIDSGGSTTLERTEIDGNQASLAGAGVAVRGFSSLLKIIESTVSNNVLTNASGISNDVADPALDSSYGCPTGTSGVSAQSFVADLSALSAYEFEIRLGGSAPGAGTVFVGRVLDIQDGLPGVEIGTSTAVIPAGAVGSIWLRYTMDSHVALVPGNLYLLEAGVPGVDGFGIMGSSSNPYGAGQASNCDSGLLTSLDFDFRTLGALGGGSGIHVASGGIADLSNSTVSGNFGNGVVAASEGSVTVFFSTIVNNSGNGLTAEPDTIEPGGNISLTASIIAGNLGDDCNGDNFTSDGYNLVGDSTNCIFTPFVGDLIGTSSTPIDPLLGPLQNNGGWTSTHAIDFSSPALDAAGAEVPGLPCAAAANDQRGVGRPDGYACDIGSYELLVPIVPGPLQVEIDAAAPGAIIIVADGIYTELISIGDGKTLQGSGPDSAVIDTSRIVGPAITVTGDFTLEGIRVTGGNSPGNGGGIFANTAGTDITLNNVVFDHNDAAFDGGAIYLRNGTLTASNTTFANNSAGRHGGAIAGAGTIEIRNSTISGNSATAGNGGGIRLSAGTANLNSVTLAFNTAPTGFGGPFYAETGALISLRNSLLSDNTGRATDCSTVVSLGYNLFQTTPCPTAASDITAEPLIDLLASNGGPTPTHALLASSPAVDAADPGQLAIELASALSASQLNFNGVAIESGGDLVPVSGGGAAGSIFASAPDEGPFDLTGSFSTRFSFQITNPVAWEGAPSEPSGDGFTFAIAANPTVLGESGGRLGVATSPGPLGTVSVEFDTWANGDDISTNAIGINVGGFGNGDSVISAAQTAIPGGFDDGNVWTAWIEYRADTNRLDVRVAVDGIRPDLPQLSHVVDIAAEVGATGYYGFTGGTGAASATHTVTDWEFFITSCPAFDQRGVSRPKDLACDIGAFETQVALELGPIVLNTLTLGQGLDDGTSYPGVVDIPIIEIPIEKLTGNSFNSPSSAPLGSFPLGSFPIGSFDLQSSPLGSFPLGSFPIGSFPLGSFPLGSFPLSSIPLLSTGGWTEILNGIPELAGAPLQTVTLERLLRLTPLPDSVASITLRDLSIQGSPLASLSLPGLSLGDTTVEKLDEWAQNADPGADTVCATLLAEDPLLTGCTYEDTLLGLEMEGAPVSALSLASLPLGSFQVGSLPIGSFPLGSFPIGSFPLGSFPLGSFPLGSFPIGSFPIGSFPLGSFPLGSFPLGSFNLLAAPTSTLPLGSFPIGSFPLGSFEIDGKSFCEFYDEQALVDGADTCEDLSINQGTDSLADLIYALQLEAERTGDTTGNIGSTPLGSFPMGSFPIGSFPIGSFGLDVLGSPPVSLLTLGGFDGCTKIAENSTDTCATLILPDGSSLDNDSTLEDVATVYGTLAVSPLGSFPIGSFGIADLPMGSFPLGSFEINGTPLGSFPLGSFDLVTSPLGSFPLGSFPLGSFTAIIDDPDGLCSACLTLADAALAGVISATARLDDLTGLPEFASTTLGEVLDAMTLAILYGPGTLADIENTGSLTLGQLLIAMMLKTDFPWETISLEQLDAQEFSADNFIAYEVDFRLSGSESEPFAVAVTLADSFLYIKDSSKLLVSSRLGVTSSFIDDPVIVDNDDDTQTLFFDLVLGGFSDNKIKFTVVPALALGDYAATATVKLGTDDPVSAENTYAAVTVIPDPLTDPSIPGSTPVDATPDVLLLGFIDTRDDNDFFAVEPQPGERVAVFMSNPGSDNDLIMYEPLTSVEAKGQEVESAALDSVPFEDDGVDYEGNLTEEPNALEDVNLATAPLASISTNRHDADESVSAIAGNADPFVIQVSGYNGATSVQPYTLRVKVTPQVQVPQCTPRSWPVDASSTVFEPEANWMPDTNAVFLVNWARLAASDPDGATGADDALVAINDLIHAPGITNGVVIDVSSIAGVDYSDWDANPCDVDAPNAIVNAITEYLEDQREFSPNLAYVTIVGSDEVIPFARKPDETSISNESTFAGEFSDNAMFGALVTRHFLSDDTYGDIDPIPWLDRYLNVPELGVGRLVESAEDIQNAAENYVAFGGMLDPQTALSAGYDFIADAAQDIDDTFSTYGPALGFVVEPALIDQPDVDPLSAWTRSDFLSATRLNTPHPVGLVSFNMHFDFDEALPSSGDAAGNYTENLITTADLGSKDLAGGIWFTVGCHSGSNLADISVVGGAPSDDWAQAFSHLGALFLAQNAYGLGDTEAVALTERLLALFARNLNGSLTVGHAHAFAKQQYFADLGLYGEYDYKALQAATLFGLPMYQYGNGAKVVVPPLPALPVTDDPISGLASATWSESDTGITRTSGTSKGDLFSVDGEVQFIHFRPLQPIVRRDVTSTDGEIASGAFLTALITEDIPVDDIAFARPVIALGEIESEIETDEVVFPSAFTNIANYKAPPPEGGPFAPRQQLNVIVGQFTSPMDGKTSGTERLFRSFETQIFYRPALTAPTAIVDDSVRPEFDNVQASVVGSTAQQAAFSVDVTDSDNAANEGTVLRVAVLYLQSVIDGEGHWGLVDLVKGAGNSWTGGGPVDATALADDQVDYMVQAVDSNGNVANSTFKGLFYFAKEISSPPAPDPDGDSDTIGVVMTTANGPVDNPDDWISTDPVTVEITNKDQDTGYEYSIDFGPFVLLTGAGFEVTEDGVHIITVQETDGSNPVTFVVLIDTRPPQVLLTTPANGEFIVQDRVPSAAYDCLDAGSGIETCVGTVSDGVPVPAAATGSHTFLVTAQDDAHLGPVSAEHVYTVVQALEVNGPIDPVAINDLVTITASATDLDGVNETATIDWGDGSPLEPVDLGGISVNNMEGVHTYLIPDVYQITVTVNYEGQFTQVGTLNFVEVYNSGGGFVTGSGWINSPPGAYTPNDASDPYVTGKTHFGFVSKYKKGQSVPNGSVNFRFTAGKLEFNATVYEWMIVSGARARLKGEGTVDGSVELYKFQITALDAEASGEGIAKDGFRIRIWQEDAGGAEIVLYDNGLGADDSSGSGGTTPLGGGSITVHQDRKK